MATSKHRAVLVAAFALLLLGMQREAQVHALQHLGGILHPAQQQGIQAPLTDVVCLECSLLAGGASAVAVELPALPPAVVATQRLVSAAVSRTLYAPSYYSARAPPPLL